MASVKQFKDLTGVSDLVQIEFENPKSRIKKKVTKGLGCINCSANKRKDIKIHRIKGLKRIKQRKIFIWAQNPDAKDNDEGLELSGTGGKWLWAELKRLGIGRSDCDIQNVVRCYTPVWNEDEEFFEAKEPPKDVAKCCSIYTKRAIDLNAGKAKVHLVFGLFAQKQLLGREFKKDTPVFWSDKLQAKVVCLDHPNYFVRGFASASRLQQFREKLELGIGLIKHSGRFSYLKQQDYKLLFKPAEVKEYLDYVKAFCKRRKKNAVVDIEDGYTIKDYSSDKLRAKEVWGETPGAKHKMLIVGVTHAPGIARSIVLDHPDSPVSLKVRHRVKRLLRKFLNDRTIPKVLHYGSSDTTTIRKLLKCGVRGYKIDTNYSTYLLWPQLRAFGLDALTKEKLPEFAGYKDIVKEYLVKGKANFATIPLKIHNLYNGGDCDVTKRLEILTVPELLKRNKHSRALLTTYRHVAFTLRDMTDRGPLFDLRYAYKVRRAVRERIKVLLKKLRKLAKDPDFNPRSPQQVKKILYETLKLPIIVVKRKEGKTDEATLKILSAQTKHPFIEALLEIRGLNVMKNTTLAGFIRSAKRYGRLRTTFWLTGGITGRLRSGGKEEKDIVPLQNVNKDPVIKNLLISDPEWRKFRRWVKENNLAELLKRKVYLIADYSAIELRVIGEIAEPKFIPIFKSGKDIHGLMGSGFTDWTYEQIVDTEKYGDEIRTKVKNINFGLPFGLGKPSFFEGLIARGTKITRKQSDALYDAYFAEYTGVVKLQKESTQMAIEDGFVATLFGFHRPILGEDDSRSTYFANQAVNSRVQGTAHQYLLFALALLHVAKKRFNRLQESSMEIHDALAFFSYVKHMQQAYKQLKELMEVAVPEYVKKYFKYTLKIPLVAEVKAGFRMGAMVKYRGESPIDFMKAWLKTNKEVNTKVEAAWGFSQ